MSGYHIEWLHSKSKTTKAEPVVKSQTKKTTPTISEPELALKNQVAVPAVQPDEKVDKALKESTKVRKGNTDSCDVLIFKDGTEKSVNITEISNDLIKYRRCDMPDGPIYSTSKSELFMAKYRNGTRETFKSETPIAKNNGQKSGGSSRVNPNAEYNTKAILSFIFGIVGLFFGLGLAALLLGNSALDEMDNNPGQYRGRQLALIGKALGIIKLIVVLAIFIILILFFLSLFI